jgi:hypothetical protein
VAQEGIAAGDRVPFARRELAEVLDDPDGQTFAGSHWSIRRA